MSKRAATFQGKPEQPFEPDGFGSGSGTSDAPRRATTAQLARRKIATAKPRRTAAATISAPLPNPFASQPSSFGQQQSTPSFGTTNSFPPAQSATPNTSFTNTSFPTFGGGAAPGGNSSGGFNFAPPTAPSFNFTAGASNAFASGGSGANGTSGSGFSGSIFNLPPSQPPAQKPSGDSAPFGSGFQTNNSAALGSQNSSSNIFAFGAQSKDGAASQKPATSNFFGAAEPNTPQKAGSSTFGAAPSTTPQKEPTSFFGTTQSTTPQKEPTNLFGAGHSTTPFGTPAAANKAPSPSDDAMQTSPDVSPQKTPVAQPQPKPLANSLFGSIGSIGTIAPKGTIDTAETIATPTKTDAPPATSEPSTTTVDSAPTLSIPATPTITTTTTATTTTMESTNPGSLFAQFHKPKPPTSSSGDTPHIEQDDKDNFNPFAKIQRPPAETPSLFNASAEQAAESAAQDAKSDKTPSRFGFNPLGAANKNPAQAAVSQPPSMFGSAAKSTAGPAPSTPAPSLFSIGGSTSAQQTPGFKGFGTQAPATAPAASSSTPSLFATTTTPTSSAANPSSLFAQATPTPSSNGFGFTAAAPVQNASSNQGRSNNNNGSTMFGATPANHAQSSAREFQPTPQPSFTSAPESNAPAKQPLHLQSNSVAELSNLTEAEVKAARGASNFNSNDVVMQQVDSEPPLRLLFVQPMAGFEQQLPRHVEAHITYPEHFDQFQREKYYLMSMNRTLNFALLESLKQAPVNADWSRFSEWHLSIAKDIRKQWNDVVKREKEATAHELHPSQKRKADEEPQSAADDQAPATTPFKKARGDNNASINTPIGAGVNQTPSSDGNSTHDIFSSILDKSNAPSANTPAAPASSFQSSSSLFAKASTPAPASGFQASSSLFANAGSPTPAASLFTAASSTPADSVSKPLFGAAPSAQTPSKTPFAATSTTPTPSFATSTQSAPKSAFGASTASSLTQNGSATPGLSFGAAPAAQTPAKSLFGASTAATTPATVKNSASEAPKFGFTPANSSATSGWKPSFGAPASSNAFASQFGQQAQKSAKDFEKEIEDKAMAEDYDSEEETEEQWRARYRKKKEEEKLKLEQAKAEAGGFKLPSTDSATTSKATTNEPFGSRTGSPTPSTTGGLSVFHAPRPPMTGGHNIFGHLSGAESSGQDAEDDTDEEPEETEETTEQSPDKADGESSGEGATSTQSQRNLSGGSALNSSSEDDSFEAHLRRQKAQPAPAPASGTVTPKGSLFDRITRDTPAEADSTKENKAPETNGVAETPKTNLFGNINSGSASLFKPSASTSLFAGAGDQTYKAGSPLKFSQSAGPASTAPASAAPIFKFQPSTPTSTPSKPAAPFGGFQFAAPTATPAAPSSFLSPAIPGSSSQSVFGTPVSSRAHTPLSADEHGEPDEGNEPQVALYTDLTDEEKEQFEVLFHAEIANAKEFVVVSAETGEKAWKQKAKGPLWLLKNKATGTPLIRMRILPSGKMPINDNLPPKLPARRQQKLTKVPYLSPDGKIGTYVILLKDEEIAKQFEEAYNANKRD